MTSPIPKSPAIHFVYAFSVVSGEKIDCIHRLWLAWRKTPGHRLPVFRRSQASTKLTAMAESVNVGIQNQAGTSASR